MSAEQTAQEIVGQLDQEYRRSVDALRGALRSFMQGGPPPAADARRDGLFAYPELRLAWAPGQPFPRISRAFARIGAPGRYAVTVTRPDLFRDYLVEQLTLLMQDFEVTVEVGRSRVRTATKVIVGVVAVAVVFLALVNREYLEVYDTRAGQFVLAIVGAVFATGGWLLTRMARIDLPDRFTARATSPSLTGVEP